MNTTTTEAGITLVDYESRDKWLAGRLSGVGASESAALFGVSPWHTKLSLWAEKTGQLQADDLNGEWIAWGNLLEEPIAKRYAAVTGRKIWQGGPYCVAQHPTLPMMRATPDRWVIDAPDRGSPGLLQVKNTASFRAHDWSDGPPDYVQIQVQHEMSVTGRDWASVAVLIGGNQFKFFDVERSPDFIAELEEQCQAFWRMVERRDPPGLEDIDRGSLDTLKRLHPADNGTAVDLPAEAIDLWDQLAVARKAESDAKKAKEDLTAKLAAVIGPATFGLLPDGRRLSFKTTARTGFSVEPTTFRSLKLEKGKRP